MIANNWQRLNIWLKLTNKFDYSEYAVACSELNVVPHSAHEFAQKAGMITAGMIMYPELPVAEAYLTFVREHQQAFTPQQHTAQPTTPSINTPDGYKREKVTITYSDGRQEEQEIIRHEGDLKGNCCGGGTVK